MAVTRRLTNDADTLRRWGASPGPTGTLYVPAGQSIWLHGVHCQLTAGIYVRHGSGLPFTA